MFIVLVLYIFLKIGRFVPLRSRAGPERKAAKRMTGGTRYAGFPVTLIKSYSWKQRTE